jgi:hypothetical protein
VPFFFNNQPQQTMQKFWAKTILLSQTDMFWPASTNYAKILSQNHFAEPNRLCFDQPQQTMPKFWAKTILLSQTDYVLTFAPPIKKWELLSECTSMINKSRQAAELHGIQSTGSNLMLLDFLLLLLLIHNGCQVLLKAAK